MEVLNSGFKELEHTADWAIRVWAPDLPILFVKAAEGMNSLSEIQLEEGKREKRFVSFESSELETLLVMFLEEILFLGEHQGIGFDRFEVKISEGYSLSSKFYGTKIVKIKKEIKAVTFHNLKISQTESGYEVMIVFDV